MAPDYATDLAAGARPCSFSGASTASDSSDAPHYLQRPITSRFVEGSMNDRSSRAPPVSFLGAAAAVTAAEARSSQDEQHGFGYNFTRRSLQMARPSFSSFRAGSSSTSASTAAPAPGTTTTTSNTASSISTTSTASTTATTATTSTTASTSTLRRPRSFLAPFWDGVAKRLHRRARSTLETDLAKKKEEDGDTTMADAPCRPPPPPPQMNALPALSDRPSPDEVFANYQQLMQAGYFTKRAIPATRQGLSGGSGAAAAATPANTPASSCPDRFPPPPPRPAFLYNGAPLSPVAPSPRPTPMATTPRGTKRIRADADAEHDSRDGKDDAFHIVSAIAASDAPLSSPTRTPRKTSKKLRKASSRLPGGETLRSVAASQPASSGRPATRSGQHPQNVQVHQTLPPLPMPQASARATEREAAVTVSSTASRNAATKKRKETGRPTEPSAMVAHVAAETAPDGAQEPRKKRRSQGLAVVHQVQQETSFSSGTSSGTSSGCGVGPDSDSNVIIYDEEGLRAPPTTHYHKPLGPRNPVAADRGSSNSRRAPRKAVLSSATSVVSSASSESTASDEQAPISFHYPQRVRVRRPMQAQVVEVKASSAPHGRTRATSTSTAAVDDGRALPLRAQPLQAQPNRGYQSKPVTRASRGKNLLFGADDAENQMPVWQD